MRSKTITTVLSKPIQRPIFIIAKFFGVAFAVALAHYICTIALLMTIRHGVLETARDTHDFTVIAAISVIAGVVLLLSGFFNYSYDWKFSSTAIVLTAVFMSFGMIFLAFIDRDWRFNPANNGINALDVYGAILLFLGVIIVAALALAFSARFNIVITLLACGGIFLLGLVSDWAFGELAKTQMWAKICYFAVPNLQVFWIIDAIYEYEEGSQIPFMDFTRYFLGVAVYALCYTGAILALAIAIFQRRQVG
jgi:hypothetical protein